MVQAVSTAPKPLLTQEEAAVLVGVKPSTLQIWRVTGRYGLPYVKSGRLVRYRESDVLAFLDRRTQLHTGQLGSAP